MTGSLQIYADLKHGIAAGYILQTVLDKCFEAEVTMNRTYINELKQTLNQEILIQGFVENFRNSKNMAFIVLKDITGKVQITIEKDLEKGFDYRRISVCEY